MNKNPIKCERCGKFIAYKDIPDEVIIHHSPDTECTVEKTEFIHKKHLLKSEQKPIFVY